MELVGLLLAATVSAEKVVASCRASLLVLAPGIVAASSAADQLAEVHARLDEIWHQTQNDSAAGRVELPPPVMNEAKPVPAELAAAVEPAAVIEVIEALVEQDPDPAPAADPDELPEAWRDCVEPVEPIEDEPEVVWLRSDDLAAALNVSRTTVLVLNRRGVLDGMTRRPLPGEGWGRRFDLEQCRAAYEARPGQALAEASKPHHCL